MSEILKVKDFNKGAILKQGDSTTLKYYLYDADEEQIESIIGKTAEVVFIKGGQVYYRTNGVISDLFICEFKIEEVLPTGVYHIEFLVDGHIFPSGDKPYFTLTASSKGINDQVIKAHGFEEVVILALEEVESRSAERLADLEANYAVKLTELQSNDVSLATQLAQTDLKANSRIDNLIISGGQDSSAEVADGRVDAVGVTHDLIGQRISADYNNVQTKVAENLNIQSVSNLIKNGNFGTVTKTDGYADDWSGGTSVTNAKVQNFTQYWTPGSVTYGGRIESGAYLSNIPNHKYYIHFIGTNVGTLLWSGSSTQSYTVQTDGFYSAVFTPIASHLAGNLKRLGFYGRVAGVESSVKEVALMDLTALYGEGNEPSKAEMDSIMESVKPDIFHKPQYLFDAKKIENQIERLETKQATAYVHNPNRNAELKVSDLKLIASCENANQWTVTAGTLTTVTEITVDDYPLDYNFGKNRLLPRWGKSMTKLDFNSPTVLHRPIDENIKFMSEEIALSMYIDDLADRKDISKIEIRFHSDYPNLSNNYFSRVLHDYRRKTRVWEYLIESAPWYWLKTGNPDWTVINGISLHIDPTAGDKARVYLGGIYKYDKQNTKGAIMLDFDDSLKTFYTEAFDYMTVKKGYRGSVGVVGSWIEDGLGGIPQNLPTMTLNEHLEMQDAGWDMCNHVYSHEWVTGTEENIIEKIEVGHNWMLDRGLTPVALIPPGNNVDSLTRDILSRYYKISRGRGPAPTSFPVPNLINLGSWEMNDTETLEIWRAKLKYVQDNRLLWNFHFHNIGDTGYGFTTVDKFKQFIDAIGDYDIDVLTYSDIINGKWR